VVLNFWALLSLGISYPNEQLLAFEEGLPPILLLRFLTYTLKERKKETYNKMNRKNTKHDTTK
jgi:hypothetical protein